MYLLDVLDDLSKRRGTFSAEDLYKLNEAVFNLPEVDVVNTKTAERVFTALKNIMKAYNDGRSQRADPNFLYDYIALIATMQNQHFFNDRQNKVLLGWLQEALGHEFGFAAPAAPAKGKGKDNSAAVMKEVAKLEAENETLRKEIEQLRALSSAVQALKAFKPLQAAKTDEAKPKAKAKAKVKRSKGRKDGDGEEAKEEAEGSANEE